MQCPPCLRKANKNTECASKQAEEKQEWVNYQQWFTDVEHVNIPEAEFSNKIKQCDETILHLGRKRLEQISL